MRNPNLAPGRLVHKLLHPFQRPPAEKPLGELEDMQGLLLHGYRKMTELALLFLRIGDAVKGRAWLGQLAGDLTTADEDPWRYQAHHEGPRHTCVNVAFTPQGLEALGLSESTLATLPLELRQGMARRAREHLRDVGENDPDLWELGGTRHEDEIHVLLLLYAQAAGPLEVLVHEHRERAERRGLSVVYEQRGARHAKRGDPMGYFRDHFGFLDGVSQPRIEGFVSPETNPRDYDLPLKAGEFILGREDEYDEQPPSPRVAPWQHPGVEELPRLADPPDWRDLGRNGSYLVLRKLEQDVDAFNDFLGAHAELAPRGLRRDGREWVAAKLMGRWRDGTPLASQSRCPLHALLPGASRRTAAKKDDLPDNSFRYGREDPHGLGCPVTAHARRCNPRDALPPSRKASMKVSRRHRIVRRGFNYEDADTGRKGLLFMGLNTHLERQFEFIQRSWVHFDQLSGIEGVEDPLAGDGGGRLLIPHQPQRHGVMDLGRFVTTRGGGYFFLPGVKAVRFLAKLIPMQVRRGVDSSLLQARVWPG